LEKKLSANSEEMNATISCLVDLAEVAGVDSRGLALS
jgi:ABC-type transporter Mla MlaB component